MSIGIGAVGGYAAYNRQYELDAVRAAKVDGDTKRMAIVNVNNGMDAAEAIYKAQEQQFSFGDILKSKMM